MSNTTRLFSSVPVEQQKASSFDMSFYSLGSAKCGQLIPVFKQDIIPGDLVSLGIMSQIDLPPMAANFMGRIDMRYEAFFVPNRICWGGWEDFMTKQSDDPYSRDIVRSSHLPYITFSSVDNLYSLERRVGRSTLFDYLGYRFDGSSADNLLHPLGLSVGADDVICDNALCFLAYHRIYDDWYRNSQIQKPLFVRSTGNTFGIASFPWLQFDDNTHKPVIDLFTESSDYSTFDNGDEIDTIHQRNWADDRFTTLALYPQAALQPQAASVVVTQSADKSVSAASLSIPTLRAANILQRYKELKNLAGERYPDQLYAEYGVRPADAILDRPLFIGSFSHGVYTSAIFQNSATDKGNSKNPFSNQLGSSAGDTSGFGKNSLINGFKATEHGYVIVIGSLVPHCFYSNGIDGDLLQSRIGDIASPKLQGLGEQSVHTSEIVGSFPSGAAATKIFGYTPQYSRYKYRNDEVHGELRDTALSANSGTLRVFALQRSLKSASQSLDSSFIEIPSDFLDQVFAVTSEQSGYGYMWYIQWQLTMTRPLAEYIIPTLGDPKDTYTTRIPLRGKQIKG
ncbi:MAG: major capsid protein [Microviridae sp.]|nr:MAG: major capsid protein [Microviridae sp.]